MVLQMQKLDFFMKVLEDSHRLSVENIKHILKNIL